MKLNSAWILDVILLTLPASVSWVADVAFVFVMAPGIPGPDAQAAPAPVRDTLATLNLVPLTVALCNAGMA